MYNGDKKRFPSWLLPHSITDTLLLHKLLLPPLLLPPHPPTLCPTSFILLYSFSMIFIFYFSLLIQKIFIEKRKEEINKRKQDWNDRWKDLEERKKWNSKIIKIFSTFNLMDLSSKQLVDIDFFAMTTSTVAIYEWRGRRDNFSVNQFQKVDFEDRIWDFFKKKIICNDKLWYDIFCLCYNFYLMWIKMCLPHLL